jgi:hypothetical protein
MKSIGYESICNAMVRLGLKIDYSATRGGVAST